MEKTPKFITREYIKQHPEIIFVFGDNLMQDGLGGQAKECRGEPNAFGVPTKCSPAMKPASFFKDESFILHTYQIDVAIAEIPRDGRKITVIPGIGTGLAQMPKRCPKVYRYLVEQLKALENENL